MSQASLPNYISNTTSNLGRGSYLPGSHLLDLYRKEYEFALVSNWDGHGAMPLTPSVIDLANVLVQTYASREYLVEVAPGTDGSISFIWDDESGNYVYLDVGPKDSVHLYYEISGEPKWEGVSVASDSKIRQRLQHALRFVRISHTLANLWLPVAANQNNSYSFGQRTKDRASFGFGSLVPTYS